MDDNEYEWVYVQSEEEYDDDDDDRESNKGEENQSKVKQQDEIRHPLDTDSAQTADEKQAGLTEPDDNQQDDVPMLDNASETGTQSEPDDVNYEGTEHCSRHIVFTACLDGTSKNISNNVAVIDFGESFLESQPRGSTGMPPV